MTPDNANRLSAIRTLSILAIGLALSISPATAGNTPYQDGWVISAYTDTTGDVRSFSGTWTVPTSPSQTSDDQTVYIWLGSQPDGGGAVLQPVLGFSGKTNTWSVGCWYVVNGGGQGTQVSSTYPVSVGDSITGSIAQTATGTNTSGQSTYTYSCSLQVNGEDIGSDYQLTGVTTTNPLTNSYVVLEGWNCLSCADYPDTTKVSFTDLDISFVTATGDGKWDLSPNTPPQSKCTNLTAEVVTQSYSDGAVDLYFDDPTPTIYLPSSTTWNLPGDVESLAVTGIANEDFTVTLNGKQTVYTTPASGAAVDVSIAGSSGSIAVPSDNTLFDIVITYQ